MSLEFKDPEQYGGEWLPLFAKVLIIGAMIFVISMFFRTCTDDQIPTRVRLGGSMELGDSYSQ